MYRVYHQNTECHGTMVLHRAGTATSSHEKESTVEQSLVTYEHISDHALDPASRRAIRELLDAAFGNDFSDDDSDHTAGGIRVIARDGTTIVGHAAVVDRRITIGGTKYTLGYVEGVAVAPQHQGKGIGAGLMQRVTALCAEHYPVAMLSTGEHAFYAKYGWQRFAGESSVDDHGVITRTADEDEGLMVLTAIPDLNHAGVAFVCDWRPGDVW